MRDGITRKFHVYHRTDNLYDFALAHDRILSFLSEFSDGLKLPPHPQQFLTILW